MATYRKWLEAFDVTLQATAREIDSKKTFADIITTLKSAFDLNANIKNLSTDFVQISKVVGIHRNYYFVEFVSNYIYI